MSATEIDTSKVSNLEARLKLKAVIAEMQPIDAEEDAALDSNFAKIQALRDAYEAKHVELDQAEAKEAEPLNDEREKIVAPFEARRAPLTEKLHALQDEFGVSCDVDVADKPLVCHVSGLPILLGDDYEYVEGEADDDDGGYALTCLLPPEEPEEEPGDIDAEDNKAAVPA